MYEETVGNNSPGLHHFTFYTDVSGGTKVGELHFQDGMISEHGVNGTTNEVVISAVIYRIRSLNELAPCRENSLAITKLEEALHWLDARTKDRQDRGVEGTDKP